MLLGAKSGSAVCASLGKGKDLKKKSEQGGSCASDNALHDGLERFIDMPIDMTGIKSLMRKEAT